MWHTSAGDRTLESAEAILVAAAIDSLVEDIDLDPYEHPEDAYCTGVELFDALTPHQKISLVHTVALHLLEPTPATIPLTASSEAAVAAIFAHLLSQTEIEIDLFDYRSGGSVLFDSISAWRELDSDEEGLRDFQFFWRTMIKDAYRETSEFASAEAAIKESGDGDFDLFNGPELESSEISQWEECIESLTDRILWDRDFEMAGLFVDEAPEKTEARKALLGIEPDYYVDLVPDPQLQEIPRLLSATRDIVRRKPR